MNIMDGKQHYDTMNLRGDAQYEIKVSNNVFWVPARALGDTRYKNEDIMQMLQLPPEEKRQHISNLYEALQLFQLSAFRNTHDVRMISEGGKEWEHHKPGFHSVRTNEGCCASDASWLCYILKGKYEEVGYFTVTQLNGTGHAINYIKHDSWYFFIDLVFHEAENREHWLKETGDISHYNENQYITAKFHKAKTPLDFAMMYRSVYWRQGEPVFFIHYTDECPPIAIEKKEDTTEIFYPDAGDTSIVYQKSKGSKIKVSFTAPPQALPEWWDIPDGTYGEIKI